MSETIIIGGGPAGLAVAKCLRDQGRSALILEKEQSLGSSWRRHYDRLHLHTARARSHLPGKPFPKSMPQYIPRADFVAYLDDYVQEFDISAELGAEVTSVTRDGDGWRVTYSQGGQELSARAGDVVLATGFAQQAHFGDWPGLSDFPGPVLHTRDYRRPEDLPGQRVLVVGFGNSGGEIAIDLVEAGRDVEIAVRGRVNLLPKELFGIPIGNFEIMQKLFGPRMADRLNAPILRMVLGDYEQYGLRKASVGPQVDVIENGRVPLIDLGTLALMRQGKLRARPGPQSIDGDTVTFTDGSSGSYDAILMATGYRVDLRGLLGAQSDALDPDGRPKLSGGAVGEGLWAISYHAVTNGQLNAITQQAPKIAAGIAAR